MWSQEGKSEVESSGEKEVEIETSNGEGSLVDAPLVIAKENEVGCVAGQQLSSTPEQCRYVAGFGEILAAMKITMHQPMMKPVMMIPFIRLGLSL